MSQHKHEASFEDYLEGDSPLSTSYQQASSEQAPAHLDDAILAASRRAVQSRPRYAFSPFASDWHVPLSLAAVLVLSLTVVLTMQKESDGDYLNAPVKYEPQAVSKLSEDDFSVLSSEVKSLPLKNRTDKKKDVSKTAVDSVSIRDEMKSAGKSKESTAKEYMALPARQRVEPVFDLPSMDLPGSQPYAPEPSNIPSLREREYVIEMEETAVRRKIQQEQSKQAGIESGSRSVTAIDMDGAVKSIKNARMIQLNKDRQYTPTLAMGGVKQTPENWLALIKQLWADGSTDEAVQELKHFYKQYPDYQEEKIKQSLDQELIDEVKTGP